MTSRSSRTRGPSHAAAALLRGGLGRVRGSRERLIEQILEVDKLTERSCRSHTTPSLSRRRYVDGSHRSFWPRCNGHRQPSFWALYPPRPSPTSSIPGPYT
ncbi:unnamed protein product [Peniophora sp. CBMAI 1063]|nr:unnamed protein product [Peniophora sp. CBMAI 1063]